MGITVSSYRRLGRLAFPQAGPTTQVRFVPTGCLTYHKPLPAKDHQRVRLWAVEAIDLHRFNFVFRGRAMQLAIGYGPQTDTLVVQP